MVALPAAPNCVILTFSGTVQGGTWANVWHLQYTGPAPTSADLTTMATGAVTAWTTNIAPLCGLGVTLTGWSAADLSSQTSATAKASIVAVPGTRTGAQNTNQACLVGSWSVNLRYRGGHPRTYWPAGVQADVTTGNSWATAFRTLAQTNLRNFRTALNALTTGTTTYKLVMLSYYSGKVLRPQPLPVLVNDVVVHGRVDTQRHRLGKETP